MTYYPANKRYEAANIVKVTIGFNRKTEPELLARIQSKGESEGRAGYVKRLIREDMRRERGKE